MCLALLIPSFRLMLNGLSPSFSKRRRGKSAAVNRDRLTGDERGVLRREMRDSRSDLLWPSMTFDGNKFGSLPQALVNIAPSGAQR